MRELLCAVAAAYDKINVVHGKSEWPLALCPLPLSVHTCYFVSCLW